MGQRNPNQQLIDANHGAGFFLPTEKPLKNSPVMEVNLPAPWFASGVDNRWFIPLFGFQPSGGAALVPSTAG